MIQEHLLIRAAAIPVNVWDHTATKDRERRLRRDAGLRNDVERSASAASDVLYRLVPNLTSAERRHALRLRRDLFNLRSAGISAALAGASYLPAVLRAQLQDIVSRLARLEALELSWNELAASARLDTRERVLRLISNTAFLKGVALSSPALAESLRYYQRNALTNSDARVDQIERGLLRYLTRASTKATPFGTFCVIRSGQLNFASALNEPASRMAWLEEGMADQQRESAVRLNKRYLGLIWDRLRGDPELSAYLRVRLNGSLAVTHGVFRFIVATGADEQVVKLRANDVINDLYEHLIAVDTTRFDALVERLAHGDDGGDVGAAETFASQLLRLGFLEWVTPIDFSSPQWEDDLARWLKATAPTGAQDLSTSFAALLESVRAYAAAPSDDRVRVRSALTNDARHLASACRASAAEEILPVFEDEVSASSRQVMVSPSFVRCLSTLERWVQATLCLAQPRARQATGRAFFDRCFGDADGVPLATFYHAMVSDEKQREAASQETPERTSDNPWNVELIEHIRAAHQQLYVLILDRWRADARATELRVSASDVADCTSAVLPAPRVHHSVSVFATFGGGNPAAAQIVVNHGAYCGGNGRFMSRFCFNLPDQDGTLFTCEHRDGLPYTPAEIRANSYFNPDIRPPLFDHGIRLSSAADQLPRDEMALRDLLVARAPHDAHALILVNERTGDWVLPIDLGIMDVAARPPIYRFLADFTPPCAWSVVLPERLDDDLDASGARMRNADVLDRVESRPRVVFDDDLVLARRRWTVPRSMFPFRGEREPIGMFLRRLHRWRLEHSIPPTAYMRILRGGADPLLASSETDARSGHTAEDHIGLRGELSTGTRSRRSERNLRKPQFIDFTNPLLIGLLERIETLDEGFNIVFEECLPAPEDFLSIDGEAFATEFVLQMCLGEEVSSTTETPRR